MLFRMAKARVSYLCRSCGGVQTQWMGKCPDCGTWDALEKYVEPKAPREGTDPAASIAAAWSGDRGLASAAGATAVPLPEVDAPAIARESTGIAEFDRVLGGGLVPGSVVLVGGDPGIGKSTLLLQAAGAMAQAERRILYVSSEESAYQTRLRAERLFGLAADGPRQASADTPVSLDALSDLFILAETNLPRIIEQARGVQPGVIVIDSIQMIHRPDVEASPGSIAQLRRCCLDLVHLAKLSGVAVLLVGHVTKEGQLAGPKLIEHLVDTVLSFEGDRHHAHRVVRAVKNRFGTTLEVGLFEMTAQGLREVDDGALLHDAGESSRPGSVVCPAMHGSRCLLLEVQALTAPGFPGTARRRASGIDANRLAMLIAVLEKHGGLRLADQDVFASSTGGLRVTEPAADLALALAIAGAHYGRAVDRGTAVVGEVGLGGEIRRAAAMEQRIAEAARHGFARVMVPDRTDIGAAGVELVRVGTIGRAIDQLGPAGPAGAGPQGTGKVRKALTRAGIAR
jgi:DNA repair protein RadA/Sms